MEQGLRTRRRFLIQFRRIMFLLPLFSQRIRCRRCRRCGSRWRIRQRFQKPRRVSLPRIQPTKSAVSTRQGTGNFRFVGIAILRGAPRPKITKIRIKRTRNGVRPKRVTDITTRRSGKGIILDAGLNEIGAKRAQVRRRRRSVKRSIGARKQTVTAIRRIQSGVPLRLRNRRRLRRRCRHRRRCHLLHHRLFQQTQMVTMEAKTRSQMWR